jgi:hypothetical protein
MRWGLAPTRWSADRGLMQSLLLLSSSDPARLAAAVWLAAFDAALAAGLAEEQAHARANAAWRQAVGGEPVAPETGARRDEASMLAVHPWCDARPPPQPTG